MKLRKSLFLLVVGIVVPLVTLAGVLGYLLVEHEKETLRDGALARNRAFMTAVDAEIRGHLSTLRALAAAESLASGDLRRFYRDAIRVLDSQRDWQNVTMSLPSGRQVMNAFRPFGAVLPLNADAESVQRVADTLAPTVGNVFRGRFTDKYGIPLHVPVIQNEKLTYVLTAVIEPEAFARLIRAQNLPSRWISGLVDASGYYIARVPPRSSSEMASEGYLAAVKSTKEGWYRGLTVEGHDTFTAHKTSAFSNWSVGLAIPATEVYAAAYNAAWILGLGTTATLALALGFAYWMGRRIAVPIASLAAAAHSLGRNTAPTNLDTEAGIREVREVALALKEASHAIRERQALIEREQTALKAADRAKDEFLAMLGHELRNPLGAITTSAYILRVAQPDAEAAVRAQGVIERQTKHMTRLIEDLLDLSRVAMGKVTLRKEAFDLVRLASSVVRTWEESRKNSGSRRAIVLHATSVWVDADRARVEQILSNLLDNADKFSPSGKPVRVRVVPEGNQAVLEVSDEGEGIPPELLDHVFGLFVQGPHGPDRARGGMGVGLALVKRIAEMHGGTVAAASQGAGTGATFVVRLPSVAKPAHEKQPRSAAAGRAARRVVVIEDNDDAREMMLAMLTLEGHNARAFPDGASALLDAETWYPDVMLVDLGLPGIDGYEVARRVRASRLNGVRLIAVTGYGQAEDERRATEAGFDLHLTKPVSPEVLRHALSALAAKEPLH